jgi:hypothetical protein
VLFALSLSLPSTPRPPPRYTYILLAFPFNPSLERT